MTGGELAIMLSFLLFIVWIGVAPAAVGIACAYRQRIIPRETGELGSVERDVDEVDIRGGNRFA